MGSHYKEVRPISDGKLYVEITLQESSSSSTLSGMRTRLLMDSTNC